MTRSLGWLALLLAAGPAAGQESPPAAAPPPAFTFSATPNPTRPPATAGWLYPDLTAGPAPRPHAPQPTVSLTPATVVVEESPGEAVAAGQQYRFAANLLMFQPFAGRVQVRVLPRATGAWWAEAYAGGVLRDGMVGGGVRWQQTVWTTLAGDAVLVGPGLGAHVIAADNGWHHPSGSMAFLAGDVDVSWLHDFSPNFGWELGLKVGLAGRVSGGWYRDNRRPGVMFGPSLYPILSVFSGVRF